MDWKQFLHLPNNNLYNTLDVRVGMLTAINLQKANVKSLVSEKEDTRSLISWPGYPLT